MTSSKVREERKACKKCGASLPSTWRYKYCENCRRERADKRRNAGAAIGGIALTVGIAAKNKIVPLAKKAAPYAGKALKDVMNHLKR